MAYEKGARRFRPVGSRKKKTAPKYGPTGTGCPVVEEAVARLYRDQSEAHFWDLMNALNYALELKTRVLVPLDAATDPQSGAAPWAALPIPEEKAEDLPPWLLHTRRERTYLPLFTSVKTAEAERTTATRPMAERGMREAMAYALNTEGLDGVVIDPWTNSATLDNSILKGLLRAARGDLDAPGADELDCGYEAACHGWWDEAVHYYKRAADEGNTEALALLADCIYQGRGIRRSKTEARKLWKKAAAAGEVQAMIALGDDAPRSGSASPRPRPASSPGGKPSPNWLRPNRASGSSWNRRPPTRSSGSTRPRNSSKSWWPRQISPAESGKTQFLYICSTESS